MFVLVKVSSVNKFLCWFFLTDVIQKNPPFLVLVFQSFVPLHLDLLADGIEPVGTSSRNSFNISANEEQEKYNNEDRRK